MRRGSPSLRGSVRTRSGARATRPGGTTSPSPSSDRLAGPVADQVHAAGVPVPDLALRRAPCGGLFRVALGYGRRGLRTKRRGGSGTAGVGGGAGVGGACLGVLRRRFAAGAGVSGGVVAVGGATVANGSGAGLRLSLGARAGREGQAIRCRSRASGRGWPLRCPTRPLHWGHSIQGLVTQPVGCSRGPWGPPQGPGWPWRRRRGRSPGCGGAGGRHGARRA